MGKTRVLFVCVHNSARSQMAEAFLNGLAGDKFVAESAGLSPQQLNPLVIAVMQESGFDLSGKKANSLFEYYKDGRLYNYVITVCDESVEERCPLFPGVRKRLYWPFQDPTTLPGSQEEKLAETRKIRDAIKSRIEKWIHELD